MRRDPLPAWFAALLAFGGGVICVLGQPKTNWSPMGWIGMVPLFAALEGVRLRRVVWLSWLFGLACNLVGFPWITELLVSFGNLPMAVAVPLHVLLSSYQALGVVLAATAATLFRRGGLPFLPAWIAGFLLSDLLFPMVFPWYFAMTQHQFLPFIQVADLVGVVGATSVLVALNVGIYLALRERFGRRLGLPPAVGAREFAWTAPAVAVLVIACLSYGLVQIHRYEQRRRDASRIPVGVIQPNISIGQKHDRGRAYEHLERLQAQTMYAESLGALLAVWPETAYPFRLAHETPDDRPRTDPAPGHPGRIRHGFRIPVLFGAGTRGTAPPRTYNSAFLLDALGTLHGPVDKNVLLIFGEYIPLREYLGFLDRWFPRTGTLAAGSEPEILPFGNLRLGVLNCYEDILPRYVNKLMDAGAPHLLVNITNDAWFGDSAEPYQHLSLAVFRSVEQRREMVRAVNTGVSAHIAATGELLHTTPIFEANVFVADVVAYSGRTIYSRLGDGPAAVLVLAAVVWAALGFRRRRKAAAGAADERPAG